MEIKSKAEKLLSYIKEYLETRFNLASLAIREKISEVVSSIAAAFILGLLMVFIFLFAGIGTALWLGDYFESTSIGFFCVTGFYAVITLLLFFNRDKWIKEPIVDAIIKKTNINVEG
jgi:hypothetical protein